MQPKRDKSVAKDVTALSANPPRLSDEPASQPSDRATPLAECDDGALARRTASGDRAAAAELIHRYQAMVRGFLRKICFDRDAAEDLSQETFVRAIKYAARFDPKYPMRTWLLTIARRLSINHGRKAKRRRGEPGVELARLEDASAPSPTQAIEVQEGRDRSKTLVDAAIKRLSDPQRLAIVMHYQQGMPLDEISQVMDMPVGTIKSHLHRGRKKMREILEPRVGEIMP